MKTEILKECHDINNDLCVVLFYIHMLIDENSRESESVEQAINSITDRIKTIQCLVRGAK